MHACVLTLEVRAVLPEIFKQQLLRHAGVGVLVILSILLLRRRVAQTPLAGAESDVAERPAVTLPD